MITDARTGLARSHRLRSSRDVRRVLARGAKSARDGVACAVLRREDERPARLGVTASRKLGSAVVRNRAKRRLREAGRSATAERAGLDVVLTARKGTISRDFQMLEADVAAAISDAVSRC